MKKINKTKAEDIFLLGFQSSYHNIRNKKVRSRVNFFFQSDSIKKNTEEDH